MPPLPLRMWALCAIAGALTACSGSSGDTAQPPAGPQPPNILFVVMDDVGVDQMSSFGYGGVDAPPTPTLDAIAQAGLKFRNTWSMPECSPGRAAFFTGRYPLRTNMYQALGPNDLANSQLSPHDETVPKLLKRAGYENAMFGKFHLAGPEHNEAGHSTPAQLGWDHFYGWVGGLPGSIDTSAGGAYNAGEWSCGFYPHHFAGACHFASGQCEDVAQPAMTEDSPGLSCAAKGGLFVDRHQCGTPLPSSARLDFTRENAYYVSPLVVIENGATEVVPLTDPRARGYRTTIETDAAIRWIKARPSGTPWMATVSYSAAHTPWQHAPKHLAPRSSPRLSGNMLSCTNPAAGRAIQNQMTEAMDTEFGRLLVETGLAERASDGTLRYDPAASNTVIVVVGDNGSLGYAVKPPFSMSLAKGTSYQTGVWVPLIVAGPQVADPGRAVEHMVNTVDLFQFFGELAGIDVHAEVPRTVDSTALLPYLQSPRQESLRTINFTQSGLNVQANGGRNGPCVMNRSSSQAGSCTQIPTSKSVCEDNGGTWWGQGYTDASVIPNGAEGYAQCWEVNRAIVASGATPGPVAVLPERTLAIRDTRFKLVRNTTLNFDTVTNTSREDAVTEFYAVDQAPGTPLLEDPASNDLLKGVLNPEQQQSYSDLNVKLQRLLASEVTCPGDGNKDGVVDERDLSQWRRIAQNWGLSSVYDFMFDGRTDESDAQIVMRHMGTVCPQRDGVY
jgi:arylsulfatase A-like enzyme